MAAAVDNFEGYKVSLDAPAEDAFSITPDDDNDLAVVTRALLLDAAGDVAVITAKGTTITLPLQAGINSVRVKRVLETGTTEGLTIIGLV